MSSLSHRLKKSVDKGVDKFTAAISSKDGTNNKPAAGAAKGSNTVATVAGSSGAEKKGSNIKIARKDIIEYIIPVGTKCKFVGEGAANVVFELLDVAHVPYLRDRLLRLPKTTKALDYNELQQYWEEKISPLFESEEVVQQSLVRLPNDKAFFENLNNELRGRDMAPPGSKLARRPTFNGYQVALDLGVGMLVEDMRSSTTDDCRYTLREVKPKWLTQAPNAPQDTERCRNCAREALRNKKSDTMKPILCPLNLVKACDFPTEKDSSERVINSFKPALSKTEAAHLTKFLHTTSLPKRLRQAQWENHHETPATDLDRLCLAMTLRDCSLFLKIPTVPDTKTSSFQVVAKLGDLDKKNIVTKKAYWENSDIALLEGNFYQSQDAYTPLIDCQLPHYKGKHLTEDLQKYYRV